MNKTAIAAFLRPYEAVFSAASGHICVHETGSIEQDGHKVIHCPAPGGKLTPEVLRSVCAAHSGEHMVLPRLPTSPIPPKWARSTGREELFALRAACDELGLLLYCDGARLGSAMTAAGADTSFPDYAETCHAFTIAGQKTASSSGRPW